MDESTDPWLAEGDIHIRRIPLRSVHHATHIVKGRGSTTRRSLSVDLADLDLIGIRAIHTVVAVFRVLAVENAPPLDVGEDGARAAGAVGLRARARAAYARRGRHACAWGRCARRERRVRARAHHGRGDCASERGHRWSWALGAVVTDRVRVNGCSGAVAGAMVAEAARCESVQA